MTGAYDDLNKLSRRKFLLGMAGFAATTLGLPANALSPDFSPFSFAFVTDIHLATGIADTYKLVHESQLFFQEIVKDLNAQNLDFVVFGGDQIDALGRDEANWELFLDIVQGINCPWFFVLGECDINSEFPVDKVRTFAPHWRGQGIETDRSYWSFNPMAGVHIIGLDTSQPNTTQGDVSRRQLEWLDKDLKANSLRFTIVFSHHPLLPPPPYDGGPPWDSYILAQGPAVREILGRSPKVRLAVSGHVHVSKVQQEKNIWYVSCPSLNVYPCAYRVFRVNQDSIAMETYQVGFEALIKKAKKMLASSTLAYQYNPAKPHLFAEIVEGEHIDNNALIPLIGGTTLQPLPKKKVAKEKKPPRTKKAPSKQKTESAPQPNKLEPSIDNSKATNLLDGSDILPK